MYKQKHKDMKLAEKWRIVYDTPSTATLEFFENRTKRKKDGSEESYEYVESFYYPNVKEALKGFIKKYCNGSKSIKELVDRMDYIEGLIDKI